LDAPATMCLGDRINFDVNDDRFTAYEWQDGSSSSRFTVQQEGIYWVKATHDCGVLSDTAIIEPCECPIWLPTAFNPNGDELNDAFVPKTDCTFKKYKFAIFDRWGEELFASEDPTKSWDGSSKGEKCTAGAYTWILTFTAIREGELIDKQINGNVTLIR
jgi:gliding motility-associated-like protein